MFYAGGFTVNFCSRLLRVTSVTKRLMSFSILLMLLLLVTPVTAVDLYCDIGDVHFISPNPLTDAFDKITKKETNHLYTSCDFMQENTSEQFYCMSYVYFNGELVQTNPKPLYLEEIGRIDSFVSIGDLVTVYFTTKNLYVDNNYTYTVECSTADGEETGSFSKNVTVRYESLAKVGSLGVWSVNNAGFIIMGIVLLMFLGLFIWGVRKA